MNVEVALYSIPKSLGLYTSLCFPTIASDKACLAEVTAPNPLPSSPTV